MTTLNALQTPLEILPGTDRDKTAFATKHWTSAKGIRYVDGFPQKIGGWEEQLFTSGKVISGVPRTIYPSVFSNRIQRIIGTHQKLYDLSGSVLTNITPLDTDTTAIADSLATHYATLANNPIATTNGEKELVITDSESDKFQLGDTYTLSGASTTNGVPDTEINANHVIRAIGVGTITIRVATSATSTGSGGGASVVRSSGLVTVTAVAHGQLDEDRTKIAGATAFGGIDAGNINAEHIIRNVEADAFDVMTNDTATSSVSTAGGAGTTYQTEIEDGNQNESSGFGYGAGLYGAGLYGTALSSSGTRLFPRIWFMDRFGDLVIGTPGNAGGLYEWSGSIATAPSLITNAPTDINYAFVSDNIIVTFGADGVDNRIKASDQGDRTNWTSSSTNQVFIDDIEGAGKLISHAQALGVNLIFTETQTYTFRKIAKEAGVWEIRLIDPAVGIIGPMARVSVGGVIFWIGQNNFYMWRGGRVEIIPANSQAQSTIHDFFFNDINTGQKSKCFAWYNEEFNEVWFHKPSANSSEPDTVGRVNLTDFTWSDDEIERTAAEYPVAAQARPFLADEDGMVWRHEIGKDDGDTPLEFELFSPLLSTGPKQNFLCGFIPDAEHSGAITLNIKAKQFPNSSMNNFNKNYTLLQTTKRVSTRIMGKYLQFGFSGSVADQDFKLGMPVIEMENRGRN